MLFEKQIQDMYRKVLLVRNDNAGGVFYFSPEDFPGLQAQPYSFSSHKGHTLKGYFYYYPNPLKNQLVIFDHGMGNGHRAYMREIETLAKAGFLVFSYDHTGCMASGGENCGGFAQSLADLDDCLNALKQEKALADFQRKVIGHSWGGFSTMNIAALHPEITNVVSMSGFVSVEKIIGQSFSGILKFYRKGILSIEQNNNPDYVNFNAVTSLQNSQAKVLLIYSKDDSVVSKELHYDALREGLADKENIRFLLLNGKDHNPTYTDDAVVYKNKFFKELTQATRKKLLRTAEQQRAFMGKYDFRKMTQQDEAVWEEIIKALKA